jgi:hypothetical protein
VDIAELSSAWCARSLLAGQMGLTINRPRRPAHRPTGENAENPVDRDDLT